MYSLPTLSSLCPKKRKIKGLPTRSLAYWGILAVEAANKNQEDCPGDSFHLQILHRILPSTLHDNCTAVHPSTGATPPPSLSIQHEGRASRGGRSPVDRSFCQSPNLIKLKMHDDLLQLYQKRLKQTSNKKVRPHEIQGRDFVLKETLPFQTDSRGKWPPKL
jgi:hypothetical protein